MKTVKVPVWIKRGEMLQRRDCLDYNDPEHTYNYLKRQGLQPEDYGVKRPRPSTQTLADMPKGELVELLEKAYNEIDRLTIT